MVLVYKSSFGRKPVFDRKTSFKRKIKFCQKILLLAFFDFGWYSVKDAQGSISPRRVRIHGVWALGGLYEAVFGVFRFSVKYAKRCARVDFPPSGPYSQSLSSGRLLWGSFLAFFDLGVCGRSRVCAFRFTRQAGDLKSQNPNLRTIRKSPPPLWRVDYCLVA